MRQLLSACYVTVGLFMVACTMGAGGNTQPPLETVPYVDIERYLGEWHIIGHIPYFAERGNVAARAVYGRRDDGKLSDVYLYREAFDAEEERKEGKAWIVDEESNAYWKVRFYWPFTFDYYIIALDEDYRYVGIGHPSRDYGWIMAREPRIDETVYQQYLNRFAAQGYDTSQFAKVPQFPEQVGQPGFYHDE